MRTILKSQPPWDSPVFVVKKKSGKWRMVTELRAVNKIIQPMNPLQFGIPLPFLLPKGWPLIVIDVKDCFYTFTRKRQKKFAFAVPT